jgi:hypothetical protein
MIEQRHDMVSTLKRDRSGRLVIDHQTPASSMVGTFVNSKSLIAVLQTSHASGPFFSLKNAHVLQDFNTYSAESALKEAENRSRVARKMGSLRTLNVCS